jgi:hypothetical protein
MSDKPKSQPGYFFLWRKIRTHWIWKEKPFSPGQAWVDICAQAAYDKREVFYQLHVFNLERTQFVTTQRQLARDFGWGRGKVRRFLENLEKTDMIRTTNRQGCIVVTISNVDIYNAGGETSPLLGPPIVPEADQRRTRGGPEADHEKRSKEVKNQRSDDSSPAPGDGASRDRRSDQERDAEILAMVDRLGAKGLPMVLAKVNSGELNYSPKVMKAIRKKAADHERNGK